MQMCAVSGVQKLDVFSDFPVSQWQENLRVVPGSDRESLDSVVKVLKDNFPGFPVNFSAQSCPWLNIMWPSLAQTMATIATVNLLRVCECLSSMIALSHFFAAIDISHTAAAVCVSLLIQEEKVNIWEFWNWRNKPHAMQHLVYVILKEKMTETSRILPCFLIQGLQDKTVPGRCCSCRRHGDINRRLAT